MTPIYPHPLYRYELVPKIKHTKVYKIMRGELYYSYIDEVVWIEEEIPYTENYYKKDLTK